MHIADRAMDMIVRGGANVYPAEVEGALMEHPDVHDAVVIGLADPDLGKRVHAVVVPADPRSPPRLDELERHLRSRLAPYKVPGSYEFVPALPRNDAGKIRRSHVAAERATVGPGRRMAHRTPDHPAGTGGRRAPHWQNP